MAGPGPGARNDPSGRRNSGTTALVFTVTLSEARGCAVTVDYTTADGTAEDESGDGDTTPEPNQTFFVDLSDPVNAAPESANGSLEAVKPRNQAA